MGFTPEERKLYRSLKSPYQIQRHLDDQIAYNKRETCYSPRLVIRHGQAHCMEGALFAAAALGELGHPPLLVDLEARRDDDHVLAVYRSHGHWGAIAKSNYNGLRYREPVYRNIRELAISYFEQYYNVAGERSLRGYSRPVRLSRFAKLKWATAEREVWEIPTYLCTLKHSPIAPPAVMRRLNPLDPRSYAAGQLGMRHE